MLDGRFTSQDFDVSTLDVVDKLMEKIWWMTKRLDSCRCTYDVKQFTPAVAKVLCRRFMYTCPSQKYYHDWQFQSLKHWLLSRAKWRPRRASAIDDGLLSWLGASLILDNKLVISFIADIMECMVYQSELWACLNFMRRSTASHTSDICLVHQSELERSISGYLWPMWWQEIKIHSSPVFPYFAVCAWRSRVRYLRCDNNRVGVALPQKRYV